MIYLIDDKKKRQEDFGWNEGRLKHYNNILQPIYSLEELKLSYHDIFKDSNNTIVLYHESFLDDTSIKDLAIEERKKLEEFANKNPNFSLVIFSGSKSSRSLDANIAHLPVSVVFQHLVAFTDKVIKGDINLKFLLFGNNHEIEEELSGKLEAANKETDSEQEAKIPKANNLFLRPVNRDIQGAIENAEIQTLHNDVSDEELSLVITEWLSKTEYDNIFIPICFGPILADYNGLKLATHIRCTVTLNQLKNIFIYSFVGNDYLFNNEYFNILKTKNIHLIDHKKTAFQVASNMFCFPLKINNLPKEIAKLKMDPPSNYEDTHSISNEWAIYQWSKTIGADDDNGIQKVLQKVQNNLYFKYLRTIFPVSISNQIPEDQLKFKNDGNPKVLLIDDEVDKGWYELFCYLLGDLNDISIDYLGEDFKKLSRKKIIDNSIKKIITDDIDIVILDFRLNRQDFETQNIQDVTSIKLLMEIKKLNAGIQVIIFSATNKVWNLQSLQAAGADGFILKGSPEYSVESEFTSKSITSFINEFQKATRKLFLKDFYKLLFQVEDNIKACDYEDESDYEGFLNDLRSQITIISQSGKNVDTEISTTLDVVFLNCFNFIEKFKNYYLVEEDYSFYLGIEGVPLHRYDYKKARIIDRGEFRRDGYNDKPSWFQSIVGLLVDYFDAIDNKDPSIKNLYQVKNTRNDYIHNKKSYFSQSDILKISDLMSKLTSSMKE